MKPTYYITNKNDQLLEVLNTIEYCAYESEPERADLIIQLKEEILENDGIHVSPEQYNKIISLLLTFVPNHIKHIQ
ncbi:hypothetical protein ACFFJY_05695 [Fictibacillus aquaticus]|uniref:Uncharacterized protein n=1 Tax=Fictibacillus aquaticus TaxID=2021314 RepID=A0A235F5H0_9BACL|nr:hypothetical protein [Fictibacillus aquaticus]OYD56167.1 hypothetical protein CGZ90_18960 [Fictibacillus aquaticus]